MSMMINIDVPDLKNALAFYTQAFGLTLRRYLGDQIAELAGWPVAVFLFQKGSSESKPMGKEAPQDEDPREAAIKKATPLPSPSASATTWTASSQLRLTLSGNG